MLYEGETTDMFLHNGRRIWLNKERHVCYDVVANHFFQRTRLAHRIGVDGVGRAVTYTPEGTSGDSVRMPVVRPRNDTRSPKTIVMTQRHGMNPRKCIPVMSNCDGLIDLLVVQNIHNVLRVTTPVVEVQVGRLVCSTIA